MPEENLDNLEQNLDDDLTGSEGENELIAAIKALNEQKDSEDDIVKEDDDIEEEVDEDEDLDEADDEELEDDADDDNEEVETPPATDKKKQSKEENAKFAKERREREFNERLQKEIAKLREQSPEFQLAKRLADMTGKPIEQIQREMDEAALQEESKKTGNSVEVLRAQRELKQQNQDLERQINQIRFEQWNSKIKSDGEALQKEYNFLTQEDLDAAKSYILNVAKNVEMPLEDAVYAIHGKKIIQNLAKAKVQDDLATQSGRKKKTPLAPNNGKPSKSAVTLTADEKAIARAFGMTDEEYNKFK
jgi:hypothetical protein